MGANRNLVLVNGRRFTIQGPDQTTDVNTIPTALIERTEIVTGGSSAVYGSDAITGVVNFIMRQDFEGIQAQSHIDFDSTTMTPTYSLDLTAGANFANDRGNVAISMGYMNRGGISREDRGGIYIRPMATAASRPRPPTRAPSAPRSPGLRARPASTAAVCPDLVFAGSGDIPNGRYTPAILPGSANAAVNAAYAAAGLRRCGHLRLHL